MSIDYEHESNNLKKINHSGWKSNLIGAFMVSLTFEYILQPYRDYGIANAVFYSIHCVWFAFVHLSLTTSHK